MRKSIPKELGVEGVITELALEVEVDHQELLAVA